MKILPLLIVFSFSSCATEVKDWDAPDPNKNANIASDISDPSHYSSDLIGKNRRGMTDEEIIELAKPQKKEKRLSGELTLGVGRSF